MVVQDTYEALGEHHPVKTVPSCFKGRCKQWFHQQCLRMYAINAGYSFICPTCRNKQYGDFARLHGIYVPEYEALWEKTHDYSDIERFYTHCGAPNCICPNGRTYTNTKWNLQVCAGCGSYGFHMLCRPKAEREDIIICDICSNVVNKTEINSQNIVVEPSTAVENIEINNDMDVIDLTDDNILEQNISSDEPLVDLRSENIEVNNDMGLIDLTDDNILEQNISPHEPLNGLTSEDIVVTNMIATKVEVIVKEPVLVYRVLTEIEAKAEREEAEQSVRNVEQDFRISLWFRDYPKFFNELDWSVPSV